MKSLLVPAAIALLASATFACHGSDRSDAAALDVAQRFLAAVDGKQWDSAAAFVDSAEVQRFRDEQLMAIASIAEHEREIVRAISATGSGGMAGMDDATKLDTALVLRHREWPVRSLPGTPSLGEVAKLPPRRFYARMYEAPINCWALPAVHAPRMIGAVVDHDSVGYAVFQTRRAGLGADTTQRETAVLTLAHSGATWRVRPRGLAPRLDLFALLDTSAAGRARMTGMCGGQRSEGPR